MRLCLTRLREYATNFPGTELSLYCGHTTIMSRHCFWRSCYFWFKPRGVLWHCYILLDKKRIPKSLHTSHPLGPTPFVGEFENEKEEADFIAYEIKRCVANMGGILKWGDFVILRRFWPSWPMDNHWRYFSQFVTMPCLGISRTLYRRKGYPAEYWVGTNSSSGWRWVERFDIHVYV